MHACEWANVLCFYGLMLAPLSVLAISWFSKFNMVLCCSHAECQHSNNIVDTCASHVSVSGGAKQDESDICVNVHGNVNANK